MAESPKPHHHHKSDSKKDKELKEKKSRKKVTGDDGVISPREAISPRPPEIPVVQGEYRIDALSCPIDFVTVYSDRAEITRLVKHPLKKGAQQLILYGICPDVVGDSIRVAGGIGKATIVEVKHAVKPRKVDDKKDEELEKKTLGLKANQEEEKKLSQQLQIIREEKAWLEKYAQSLNAPSAAASDDKQPQQRLTFAEAAEFLRFYQEQLTRLNANEDDLNKRIEDIHKSNNEIERSHSEKARLLNKKQNSQCEVSITLDAHEDTDVALQLSYILLNASWGALYDIRVSSTNNKMQLTYYGMIRNNTTEDWNDVQLQLSTAQPSVGGTPPVMNTLMVAPKPPAYSEFRQNYKSASNANKLRSMDAKKKSFKSSRRKEANREKESDKRAGESSDDDDDEPAEPLGVLTSKVDIRATSASFSIPRKATLPSDSEDHKVTIAVLELTAKFAYTVVPKLSPNAYLRATCDNTSPYPLLDGPLNVFVDSNFITHSVLKQTNPGEEFALHLGVDASIKVDLKPPKCITNNNWGLLKNSVTEDHKYVTVLKNSKDTEVSVQVFMQVPKSETDKIKVKILEPLLKETDREGSNSDIILNEFNNVRWHVKIPAKKEKTVSLQYTVDYGGDVTEVQYV